MRWRENPIVVPRRSDVRAAVGHCFETGDRIELTRFGWESCYLDRDTDAAALQRYEDDVLEPERVQYEDAARVLIEALAVGGPPPRRWQRWHRRFAWLRWYLREGRRARHHPLVAVVDDEPPF